MPGGHVGLGAGLVQETLTHVVIQFAGQVGRGGAQLSGPRPSPDARHVEQVPQQREHVQHNLLGFPVVHPVHQICMWRPRHIHQQTQTLGALFQGFPNTIPATQIHCTKLVYQQNKQDQRTHNWFTVKTTRINSHSYRFTAGSVHTSGLCREQSGPTCNICLPSKQQKRTQTSPEPAACTLPVYRQNNQDALTHCCFSEKTIGIISRTPRVCHRVNSCFGLMDRIIRTNLHCLLTKRTR